MIRPGAALAAVLLLLAAAPAHAKPREGDAVLFVREGALWKVSARGSTPEKVGDLDEKMKAQPVDRLEASIDGTVALVRAGRARRFVTVAGGTSRAVTCGTTAATRELSYDGKRVTCQVDTDTDLIDEAGKRWTERVVERLPWMVGPGAQRAVAIEGGALVVFKLDARKARRILLAGAEPLGWSADGNWVLFHWNAGERNAACIARAIGGQYKCWHGYEGVDLATDGSYVLLRRKAKNGTGYDLFAGEAAGAQTETPSPIIRNVDAPAAWLGQPGPLAPPDEVEHSHDDEEGG
jgi:hypothetical protein